MGDLRPPSGKENERAQNCHRTVPGLLGRVGGPESSDGGPEAHFESAAPPPAPPIYKTVVL